MPASTALIIGGTSGVGLATARQLATDGVSVHIAGRSRVRLDQVAASDPALTGHQLDATDPAAVAALAEDIGPIDYLIVTLSGAGDTGPFAELDLAALRTAFEEIVLGPRHRRPSRPAAPTGSITVIGAATARAAIPGTAGIAAVNGAVEALVKPLAVELAPIRVNAVSPGFVDTAWWAGMPDDARQEFSPRPPTPSRSGASPPPTTSPKQSSWPPPTPTPPAPSSKPTAAPDSSHWVDQPGDQGHGLR